MTTRFALAKQHALDGLDDILRELLNASMRDRRGSGWNVRNPNRADAKPAQMIVWLKGARRGGWTDFTTGEKGDVIDLVAYALEGIVHLDSRMRAVSWIEDRFGLKRLSQEKRDEIARLAAERRAAVEAEEAERRCSARERARKMFYAAKPAIAGTPVETYLAGRGIDLFDVPHLSPALRFQPAAQYWLGKARDGEGNAIGRAPTFPAMMSAMVSADGTLNACHLTFLEPDGRRKLDTAARGWFDDGKPCSAKLMWPEVQGFFIPVTHGPSGLALKDAAAAGIAGACGVTEGIEDALSVAIATPKLRMCAAGSLSGLLHMPDLPAVSAWLVFKDNDWGKPQAAALFERAVARLKGTGKPVEVISMPPEWGKDVNDAIRAEEAA